MEDFIKILVFQIGEELFGLEICEVRGIFPGSQYSDGRKNIEVSHTVVPVLDLHKLLQISPLDSQETMLILVSSGNRMLAFLIDKIKGIFDVSCQDVHSVPKTAKSREASILKNIAVVEEELVSIFAPEKL